MMQQNAFATDLRLRCNHPDCLRKYVLDMVGSLRSHVSSHHGADHNRHTNRKPNAPGLVLVLSKTDPNPAGVIAGAGRTAVYTVYRCMRVGARPLTVTFPHDNDARMGYVSALERAQMLLGLHHLPPLAIRRWPYAHAFGPSGSAAIPCAVVSLMTNRLCRSDTAVSVNVDVFTDLLFGVVFMAAKAHVRQLHPLGAGHAGPGDLGGVAGGGHGWTDSGVRRHGAAAAGRDVQAFAGEEHPTAIWPLQCRVHNSAQSGFRQKILSDSCITDREASNDISFVEFGLLEERGDVEERIQVVRDNKPFESQNLCNGRFTSGHFSHKIYHFNSKKLPSLLRRLLPKGSMNVHEKVWNAFPYWKEELTNPDFMKDNFMIRMETMLLSDRGTTKNAFGLTKDALNECKKMVRIDIANDTEFLSADDIHSRRQHTVESTFHSVCTGRGPLTEQWQTNCEPVMCAYKLVTVKFKWLGFQTVVESFMQKQFPRIFCMFNRALFCSKDRWYALTLTPIRLIEDEAQQALDETDELATDDPSQEMTASNGTER